MKFAATYSECVQIGEYEYHQVRTTKVFDYSQSINDVMDWLVSLGVKSPQITSVTISDVSE